MASRGARFVVRGRVQGVYFRASTVREGEALGLAGEVWNRADGGVEVVAAGAPEALDALARWLAQGPPRAVVESVERTALAAPLGRRDFVALTSPPEDGR